MQYGGLGGVVGFHFSEHAIYIATSVYVYKRKLDQRRSTLYKRKLIFLLKYKYSKVLLR